MSRIIRLVTPGLALLLASCILGPKGDRFTYSYYPGYSIKDSVWTQAVPSYTDAGDTSYYTARTLKIYPAEDSVLFFYEHVKDDDSRIADDEYSESFFFVLSQETKTLELEDSLPQRVKTFFVSSCFGACGIQPVRSGSLSLAGSGTPLRYQVTIESTYEARAPWQPDSTGPLRNLTVKGTFRKASAAPDIYRGS